MQQEDRDDNYKTYERLRPPSSRSSDSSTPSANRPPSDCGSRLVYDQILVQRHPVIWEGLLHLKNDDVAVRMHYVSGLCSLARKVLPPPVNGETAPLKITQRLKMEPPELYGVKQKFQLENEHCILVALPCGMDVRDYVAQSSNMKNNFISYFEHKKAAGIVNVTLPGSQQPDYVIHMFPTCNFTNERLSLVAPNLLRTFMDISYLVIVITTVITAAPAEVRQGPVLYVRTEPPAPSA